ncbi:hypothetical protein KCU78_g17705, partial [Aureobasidium melanogenum]
MWVQHASTEINQRSRYPMLICVCSVMVLAMITVVALRAYDRAHRARHFRVDDWTTFTSAATTVIYAVLAVYQTRLGLGLPLELRPTEDLHKFTLLNYAGRPIYVAASMTFKIGVCLGALRMLERSNGKAIQQTVIRTAILIIILSHVAIALALMLYCRPVRKAWNPHVKGKCLSVGPLFYGTAAATILCDLIAFSMPVTALHAIKNVDPKTIPRSTVDPKKTRRLIVSLFFGFFTTICSVVRTIQIREVVETGDSTMLILWGVIEACVG